MVPNWTKKWIRIVVEIVSVVGAFLQGIGPGKQGTGFSANH